MIIKSIKTFTIRKLLRYSAISLVLFQVLLYVKYIVRTSNYAFDWETSDGDHLNISKRIGEGKAIYFDLNSETYLSVYNPLYHYLLNFIGQGHQNLVLGRYLSLSLWLIVALFIGIIATRKLGIKWGLFFVYCITFPPINRFNLEMLQLAPSSLLAITFLSGGLVSNKFMQERFSKKYLPPLIIVSVLTYFSKQQGIILVLIILLYLVYLKKFILSLYYFFPTLIGMIYFGYLLNNQNQGNFWNSTVFNLQDILTSYWKLGTLRLLSFLILAFPLVILSCYSIFITLREKKSLNFWQFSFLLHLPFLLFTLRNGGGGLNYYATFLISIVMLLISYFAYKPENLSLKSIKMNSHRNLIKSFTGNISVFLLASNFLFSSFVNAMTLTNYPYPNIRIVENTFQFYKMADRLTPTYNCEALSNRNANPFVVNGCNMDTEGAITFTYAWSYPLLFSKKYIMDNIVCQKYDVISEGIHDYPIDLKRLIVKYYVVAYSDEVHLHLGDSGIQTLYVPNVINGEPRKPCGNAN